MKRTQVHRTLTVALGLLVLALLAVGPAGGVQGQELTENAFLPSTGDTVTAT